MSELVLFTTAGCHLCEMAEALLQQQRQRTPELTWQAVDIANDDALFGRYGWSIPVLRRSDGAELAWPFDAEALQDFIASTSAGTSAGTSACSPAGTSESTPG